MARAAKHKKNKKRSSGAPLAHAAAQPTTPLPDSGAPQTSLLKLVRSFRLKASSGPALTRILVPSHVLAAFSPRLPRSPPRVLPSPHTPPKTLEFELGATSPPAPTPWQPLHDLASTAADVFKRTDHIVAPTEDEFSALLKGLAYRVRVSSSGTPAATLTVSILDYNGVDKICYGLQERHATVLVRHSTFRHAYVLEFDENLTHTHIDWLRSPDAVTAQVIRVLTTGYSNSSAALYSLACPFIVAPNAINLTFMANPTSVSPSLSSSAHPASAPSSSSLSVTSSQVLSIFESAVKYTRPCDVRVHGGTLVDPEAQTIFVQYGRFA